MKRCSEDELVKEFVTREARADGGEEVCLKGLESLPLPTIRRTLAIMEELGIGGGAEEEEEKQEARQKKRARKRRRPSS